MSALSEFTGCGAIPAGPGGLPRFNPKKKKKRIVDAFLAVPSAPGLHEMAEEDEPVAAPVAAAPVVAAPPAPAPTPAPAAPAPETATPAPALESTKALMLSREVVEALMAGHAVNVRGVLLEPSFGKAPVRASVQEADPARVQSAVASVLESTAMPVASGAGMVDMNATQPPPPPPSDGRAVMNAFRRFGGSGS